VSGTIEVLAGRKRVGEAMHPRFTASHWHKALKFLKNPTVDVIAAIVVVLLSAWFVIQTEISQHSTPFPVISPQR
jgi:hypothetical protein